MIIIPAAGEGRRFRDAGYDDPKHLIPLAGRPMVDWVVANVRPLDPTGRVIIATKGVVGETTGATDTIRRALAAYPPDHDEPVVIANCDQLLALTPDAVSLPPLAYGVVYTFPSVSPAHSYVSVTTDGRIFSIIEKPEDPRALGLNKAVSGVYVFRSPRFLRDAVSEACASLSGEHYFSDALALMIAEGAELYAVDVPTSILGTPEDFQRFQTALTVIDWVTAVTT